MRIAKIENDQFIIPLSDDVEEESYSIKMLVDHFAKLLYDHGYSQEQIYKAFQEFEGVVE